MKSIVFFNNKGGVGKTTAVYHLAWMMALKGNQVLAVDLDPQSNLTSMFLSPSRMEEIVLKEDQKLTILDAIIPLSEGEGYKPVHIEEIHPNIYLVPGNLSLSAFEDKLSDAWIKCLNEDVFAFKVTSVFYTLIQEAANRCQADWVLIDVGPNLGAINRAVLISSEFVVIPVAPDLFSLQGIKNLGQAIYEWKRQWRDRIARYPKADHSTLPTAKIQPIGYLLMQYTARDSRPVKSYIRWGQKIPYVYRQFVLKEFENSISEQPVENDSNCLALLKHYHSLAPMSMEARKPMFLLKPADGAIGAHVQAVRHCYEDFENLVEKIFAKTTLP